MEFPLLCRSLLPEIAFQPRFRGLSGEPRDHLPPHLGARPEGPCRLLHYKPRRTPLPGSLGFVFHTVAKVVGGVEETRYRLKMGSERPR